VHPNNSIGIEEHFISTPALAFLPIQLIPLNANIETKPKLKSKIASSCATGQCTDVTTVQLVKSLVLTTWKLIIITAVFALLRVVTS
jgi:hypothetical protein